MNIFDFIFQDEIDDLPDDDPQAAKIIDDAARQLPSAAAPIVRNGR
jgi:hypothetical protein